MQRLARYERSGHVAWLTMDRPEKRNALNRQMREELFAGFAEFGHDAEAFVLILTGAGDRAFCAGYDLDDLRRESLTVPPPDSVPQLGRNVHLDKPVIAALNGDAYGAGFLLMQNCDLVVAAATARIGIPEAKVGRGAAWAVPLPRLVPPRIALELLLTGEPMTAARAAEFGLVNAVVDPTAVTEQALRLAETIVGNAPLAVKAAREMVRAGLGNDGDFARADDIWRPVYESADAQEGPAAFLEKRQPRWEGRQEF